jgi:hypothetical protein
MREFYTKSGDYKGNNWQYIIRGGNMGKLSSRFTPIDDLDSSCSLTHATLCIYNIDPELVSQKIGITPTGKQKQGALSVLPDGSKKIGRINSWLLESKKNVSSKDIRTHLNWLLIEIEPATERILELQQIFEVQMSIRCVWFSAEGGGGPTLWPEQMDRMAKLNLECCFAFAYYGDN